jgi:ketosteroid isomerase-like protein
MHKLLTAIAVVGLIAGPAAASDKTDVMTVIQQWVDGFNKVDMKAMMGQCADHTSIIDDIPPHEWHGSGACTRWWNAYQADAKKNEITDGIVTLSTPRHIDVTGDRAYVVVPVESFTYKAKGKPEKETGSVVTLVLRKGESGWRITAWAWAQG